MKDQKFARLNPTHLTRLPISQVSSTRCATGPAKGGQKDITTSCLEYRRFVYTLRECTQTNEGVFVVTKAEAD